MPTQVDIREAIECKDKPLALALYNEVLSKRSGHGMSPHDQQILMAEIEGITGPAVAAAPVKPVPVATRRPPSRATAAKINMETGEIEPRD